MAITEDLDQVQLKINQDQSIVEWLGVDQISAVKIQSALVYFLEQAKLQHFRVFKTHLNQFFALSEWYYAQTQTNLFFHWKYQRTKEGPFPRPLLKTFNLNQQLVPEIFEFWPFTLKKVIDQNNRLLRTQVLLKPELTFENLYFSPFELLVLQKASQKILNELKTTEAITRYFRQHGYFTATKKENLLVNQLDEQSPKVLNYTFDFLN